MDRKYTGISKEADSKVGQDCVDLACCEALKARFLRSQAIIQSMNAKEKRE
jgi:hypothetical protein